MAGWGVWVEWRGFRALAKVERLRGLLAGTELGRARAAALAWVDLVAPRLPEAGAARAAVASAAGMEELRAVLAHGVAGPLAEAAGQLGARAAWQGGALVALCPHPALDALIAGLRGLRLVREVAALHGMRPGTLATLSLARRVAVTAMGTAGVELLSQSLSDQLLQRLPVVSHLAAAVPGATLAAVRLYRLARVAALACSPLEGRGL
jgi:putative membrane protein